MALSRSRLIFQTAKRVSPNVGGSHSDHLFFIKTRKIYTVSPLVQRLLKEPLSKIKSVLDSEHFNNSTSDSPEFSWDTLLTSLNSSSPQKANLVVEWRLGKLMRNKEKYHDGYSELISLCGKIRNVAFALHIFTCMEAQGLKPTTSVLNVLLATCLTSGNLTTALGLFEIMETSDDYKPNPDTYIAFILAYANMRNKKAMQAWYSAKCAAGFSADQQTYELLLFGCIRSNDFGDAERFYEEMMLAGLVPTVSILQNMLSVYCGLRNINKTKDILKCMLDGGMEVDRCAMEKVLGLYCEYELVEDMEELLVIFKKSSQSSEILLLVHSAIIILCARADRLDDLEYAIGRMLRHGISFRNPSDVEKVICSYFRRAAYDRLDLFLESIKGSFQLTKSIYELLVAGNKRAGLSKKLNSVINDMMLAGL